MTDIQTHILTLFCTDGHSMPSKELGARIRAEASDRAGVP